MPSNTIFFFGFVTSVSNFQVITLDSLGDDSLSLDSQESSPFNNFFYQAGYQTSDFIVESGTIFIAMVTMTMLLILTLMFKIMNCRNKVFIKITNFLDKMLIFNGIIRVLIESYLSILISATINILKGDTSTLGNTLSLFLSYFFIAIIIFLPILPAITSFKH